MQNSEHPKVFISYSWSGPGHEDKIMSFAKRLVDKGIEVVIDKWSLQPGQDKFVFMEKMVNDKSIDRVLICSDQKYSEKANQRAGGVGTESTIISEKVYKEHDQTKFLPVIFQRSESGDVYLPTFISSRIYFDLSSDSQEEFDKLVRTIWEVPIYEKPTLGKKPDFSPSNTQIGSILKFSPNKSVKELATSLREQYKSIIESLEITPPAGDKADSVEKVVVDSEIALRDIYEFHKKVLDSNILREEKSEIISDFFGDLSTFLHEQKAGTHYRDGKSIARYLGRCLFILLISYCIKKRDYAMAGDLLSMQFPIMGQNPFMGGYDEFNQPCGFIDGMLNQSKNQNKISYSTDRFLMSNPHADFTLEELIEADLVIFVHSIVSKKSWHWRPLCSMYSKSAYQIAKLFLIMSSKVPSPISLSLFADSDYPNVCKKVLEYRKENGNRSLISEQAWHGPDVLRMIGAVSA